MRNFFWRLNQSLSRFMMGRYGVDKFYWFLFAVFCLLSFVRMFLKNAVAYLIVTGIAYAVLVYAFFRLLSRNTQKRYREGQKFEKIAGKVAKRFRFLKNRFRDRKTHVYRRCPSCKATLRYPRVKGKHLSTCPRCGNKITVKI